MKLSEQVVAIATTFTLAGLLAFAITTASAQAQTQPNQQPPDSVVAVVADAQGLPFVPPDQRPVFGTFWDVHSSLPCLGAPLPFPPLDPATPVYAIGDPAAGGQFLVDQTAGQVVSPQAQYGRRALRSMSTASILQAQAEELQTFVAQVQARQAYAQLRANGQMSSLSDGPPIPGEDGGGGTNEWGGGTTFNAYQYTTNDLWLEITNVSNGLSYYNLHNATNLVYAILTTTNVLTPFAPELDLWPSDTNSQPFSLRNNDRQYLFVRAEDWSGVDSDGDGVPDWWTWKYFGTVNITSTNLDLSGNGYTFAQDYSNNITPTVFNYTGLEVPNNYVSSSQPAVQMDVVGTPYYIALLIDDNNFSNAVWNTYSGSTVTVNLGSVQGWHGVWIGLRGHGQDPSNAIWQWQRLKLDYTPPQLVITDPAGGTVDKSVIQVTGYSPEALGGISYDLANAAGVATNQPVLITGQSYSTNTAEFTTNFFQAYDVPLTNGLNVLTLHATDLAGNLTTLTTNITLDYSGKTNPPAVALRWPQDGMQVSGGSFTIQGQVDDPTATVSVAVVDANGSTNYLVGLTGRDGVFWIENVPFFTATNWLALTLSNPAGSTTTNLILTQSSVSLSVNAVAAGDTAVSGAIGTNGYTVWVNGRHAEQDAGAWTAPIAPMGVAGGLVEVAAIPNSDNGGNGTDRGAGRNPTSSQSLNAQATVAPPQGVFVSAYHSNLQADHLDDTSGPDDLWYDILDWEDGRGGTEAASFVYNDPVHQGPGTLFLTDWPATLWPQALLGGPKQYIFWDYSYTPTHVWTNTGSADPPALRQEHCDINDHPCGGPNERRTADTEMLLATGGPLGSRQIHLWCLSASATDMDTSLPIPPEQIEIGGFGFQDTNAELWVLLPDNDPDNVTPKVKGKRNYSFSVNGTEYTLTHVCVADTPTNKARLTIGVCEDVDLGGMPTNTTWSASAGTLNTNKGPRVRFTAPDTETKPATVTVSVANAEPLTLDFTVLKPQKVTYENVGLVTGVTNPLGMFFFANVYVQPDTVSFGNIVFQEGETAPVVTGYFSYQADSNHLAGDYLLQQDFVPGKGILIGGDQIQGGTRGPAYTNGTFTWHIPCRYYTPGNHVYQFSTVDQVKTLTATTSSNASLTITKDKAQGTVSTN